MRSKFLTLFLTLAAAALITACGGGGSANTTSTPTVSPPVAMVTGKFVDATVVGLGYKCGASSTLNKTNASGEFTCAADEAVSFWVGDIQLGSVSKPQGIVTPLDLAGNGSSPSSARVANMVRFLMSLSTTLPALGTLTLDPAAVTAAAGKGPVDFATVSTGTLDTLITTLRPTATVFNSTQGTAHMLASLNGLFSGNYSGTFSGTASGTWTVGVSVSGIVSGTLTIAGETPDPVTGGIASVLNNGAFAFTGAGNGIPWVGVININTGAFSGTWGAAGGDGGTFTGKKN